MRVFFFAGEASGDAYAAELAKEITRLSDSPLKLEGVGGRRSQQAGIELIADSSRWGAIGIAQAFVVGPRVLSGFLKAKKALATGEPGLFIPIDFGFVNIRLSRFAKRLGWKVLYFVPPGSWRRDRQGQDLPQITNEIVTPFPWSEEILRKMGANVHWFGHPIKQLIHQNSTSNESNRQGIAVLPGSRPNEIKLNLPLLAKTFQGRSETLEFALAPSVDIEAFKARWTSLAPGRQDTFTSNDTYGALQRAERAVVCSGTATLEAALCKCPMVVFYKLSALVEAQAHIMNIKPKYISLPNILMDKAVVPELVQRDATPENLLAELDKLKPGAKERETQLKHFQELDTMLGTEDAITKAAQLCIQLLK